MKHFISLGAGVQSSTMALMATYGEIEPMPDAAIFADTQNEPESVMKYLDWLEPRLSFPVYRVTKSDLAQDTLDYRNGKSRTGANMPFYVLVNGQAIPMNRSCTRDYKIMPVRAKIKELLGYRKGQIVKEKASVWLGISTDEAHRMKPSQVDWLENRYPLIEKTISRGDCHAWLNRNGYPQAPRSACWHCPFSSNERWRNMRDYEPQEWEKAVEFDKELRRDGNWVGAKGPVFLHRSGVPLGEATLGDDQTIDMFAEECEGMCGL